MPMLKIAIENLRVVYPGRGRSTEVEALAGVSLNVAEGELVCLVGPSGCGKTTLLRVLAGLERASAGTTRMRSSDPNRPTQAMVFQGAGLFPWMTVMENVGYGLRMRGMSDRERKVRVQRWLTAIGLERFANAYPAQLSGGMQQRVGLARAFAYDAEILLMDEPFGALDAQTRLLLQQALLEQWEQATRTVIFVTHSIEEALTLGDRVIVMSARPGRLLAEFTVPFPRPRDVVALRSDPRFSALFAAIWATLRDEVDRARREEEIIA